MNAPSRFCYHQSSALLHNIVPYLDAVSAGSLLDLGAGGGPLAHSLSTHVARYCAVERDHGRALELQRAGLDVIHGTFPVPVPASYDVVLASHSVPPGDYDPRFLAAACTLVNPGGVILVITFKGSQGVLADLRREFLGHDATRNRYLASLIEHGETLGATDVQTFNSYVESGTAEEIVQFLSPWLSSDPAARDRFCSPFTRLVESCYRVREGMYVFPTQHVCVACRPRA